MKFRIAKKLFIGLSAGISALIPSVFATSCSNIEMPRTYEYHQYLASGQIDHLINWHNNQFYIDWNTGDISTENIWKPGEVYYRGGEFIDPEMYHSGIWLFGEPSWASDVRPNLQFDTKMYNKKTPHQEFTFRIIGDDDFRKACIAQEITIPAYDGIGKPIANFGDGGSGDKHLEFPWNCLYAEDTHKYECYGPWWLEDWGYTHYHHNGMDGSTLCSTRIISLPENTNVIASDAFNLEKDREIPAYSQSYRPAANEKFRQYVYGTQEDPDSGLWIKIQFEGEVVPIENIGQNAFYHCWSLEKTLASYYGEENAHNMVYYGKHN